MIVFTPPGSALLVFIRISLGHFWGGCSCARLVVAATCTIGFPAGIAGGVGVGVVGWWCFVSGLCVRLFIFICGFSSFGPLCSSSSSPITTTTVYAHSFDIVHSLPQYPYYSCSPSSAMPTVPQVLPYSSPISYSISPPLSTATFPSACLPFPHSAYLFSTLTFYSGSTMFLVLIFCCLFVYLIFIFIRIGFCMSISFSIPCSISIIVGNVTVYALFSGIGPTASIFRIVGIRRVTVIAILILVWNVNHCSIGSCFLTTGLVSVSMCSSIPAYSPVPPLLHRPPCVSRYWPIYPPKTSFPDPNQSQNLPK